MTQSTTKIEISPRMLAKAWRVWKRAGNPRVGPGPGFKEAIEAALEEYQVEEEEKKASKP